MEVGNPLACRPTGVPVLPSPTGNAPTAWEKDVMFS